MDIATLHARRFDTCTPRQSLTFRIALPAEVYHAIKNFLLFFLLSNKFLNRCCVFFNKNKIVNYLRPATLSEWPMDWRRRRYGVTAGSADWLLTYNAPFILSTYENGARTTKKTDSSSFRRWFALTVHQVNPYVRPLQWIFLIGSSASNGRIRRRLFRVIPSLTPFTKRETGVYRIVVSYRRNARITGSVKGI